MESKCKGKDSPQGPKTCRKLIWKKKKGLVPLEDKHCSSCINYSSLTFLIQRPVTTSSRLHWEVKAWALAQTSCWILVAHPDAMSVNHRNNSFPLLCSSKRLYQHLTISENLSFQFSNTTIPVIIIAIKFPCTFILTDFPPKLNKD